MGTDKVSLAKNPLLTEKTEGHAVRQYAGLDILTELVELCHLCPDQHVLDVGCGIGTTSFLLAKFGCHVTGVDISPEMIAWAKKKAKEEDLEDRVEFKVADAQDLPFDDSSFDLVISRFVLAFVEDPAKAVNEFARVAKSGGFVCVNESSWLREPTSARMIADFQRTDKTVNLLSMSKCRGLLLEAGLRDINVKIFQFNNQNDQGQNSKPGLLDRLSEVFLAAMNRSRSQRSSKSVVEYYGYGLYVARKI